MKEFDVMRWSGYAAHDLDRERDLGKGREGIGKGR
jgi:hypothetical protein